MISVPVRHLLRFISIFPLIKMCFVLSDRPAIASSMLFASEERKKCSREIGSRLWCNPTLRSAPTANCIISSQFFFYLSAHSIIAEVARFIHE